MDKDTLKEYLSLVGWILLAILTVIALFGLIIGIKWLYAWIAEQLGIPYIWII